MESSLVTTSDAGPARTAGARRWADDAIALALLIVIGAVVPLVIAHHYDALRIPRSDDWSYLRALFVWRHTGHLDFNHWVSMTLIGQLIIARPVVAVFGDSLTAIRVLVAGLGVVGLAAIVAMAETLGLSRRRGLLVAFSVGACPLWGPLAATFMTEIPAFAFQMLALACACTGWRRARSSPASPASSSSSLGQWYLVAAIAFGFVAVAIRQYAIITVIAILLTALYSAWVDGDQRRLRMALLLTAVFAVATVALLVWWAGVPNTRALSPRAPTGIAYKDVVRTSGGFLRLAGLLMLPAVCLAGPVGAVRRAWSASRITATVVGVATAVLLVVSNSSQLTPARKSPFVGNYFDARGVLADDIVDGTRPRIMSARLFQLVTVVGSVGALLLALAAVPLLVALWSRRRSLLARHSTDGGRHAVDAPMLALGLNVVGFAVGYELAVLLKLPIWDRYALPALPLVGLLVLAAGAARSDSPVEANVEADVRAAGRQVSGGAGGAARLVTCGVALAGLVALGVVYSAESASYDATRWQVAEAAVRAGYPIVDVNPGYEWVGYQPQLARALLQEPTVALGAAQRRHYMRGLCVDIVVNPAGRPRRPIVAEGTSVGLLRKPVKIYAVRTTRPCGAAPQPGAPGS